MHCQHVALCSRTKILWCCWGRVVKCWLLQWSSKGLWPWNSFGVPHFPTFLWTHHLTGGHLTSISFSLRLSLSDWQCHAARSALFRFVGNVDHESTPSPGKCSGFQAHRTQQRHRARQKRKTEGEGTLHEEGGLFVGCMMLICVFGSQHLLFMIHVSTCLYLAALVGCFGSWIFWDFGIAYLLLHY